MENCFNYGVMLPNPPVVVIGVILIFHIFIIYNVTTSFIGTLEMQRIFVFKDKLVCAMKKRMVSMATVNMILGLHYYLY